jgi:hypothetical protein
MVDQVGSDEHKKSANQAKCDHIGGNNLQKRAQNDLKEPKINRKITPRPKHRPQTLSMIDLPPPSR